MLISDLLLKAGAALFHVWFPDVREGVPLPVSAFIATVVTVAALIALGRGALYGIDPVGDLWMPLVEVTARLRVW